MTPEVFVEAFSGIANVTIDVHRFASGAFIYDVRRNERLWVVMVDAKGVIGLDEVKDSDGIGTTCEIHCDTLADAFEKLVALMGNG